MTGTNGGGIEPFDPEGPAPGSSDKAFGLVFATACGAIAVSALWDGRGSALWWSLASFVLLGLALFAAPLLHPLNCAWRWISVQLFKLANPLVMAVLFFGVLTPIGLIMRAAGKDTLRLRSDKESASYWLARASQDGPRNSMTNQF
ncbi:MAG TPA: hypothetical protein VGF39_03110 [Stellaceae bacterium]